MKIYRRLLNSPVSTPFHPTSVTILLPARATYTAQHIASQPIAEPSSYLNAPQDDGCSPNPSPPKSKKLIKYSP